MYLARVNFKTAEPVSSELLRTKSRSQPQQWATAGSGHGFLRQTRPSSTPSEALGPLQVHTATSLYCLVTGYSG